MDLKPYGIDYLLVNTTNEFLLEYVDIEENACHKLTGFSGDTGDSLVCPDNKIILFVDGRYHTQADNEVDHSVVKVHKLKLGEKQDDAICENIKPNSTLGIVSKKISQKRYEYLSTLLKEINVSTKLLDEDLILPFSKTQSSIAHTLPVELRGEDFKTKIKHIEKPALLTNSEEITYLCNLRDFTKDYAVKINGKLLLLKDKSILYTDTKTDSTDDYEVKEIKDLCYPKDKIFVDKSTINAYDYSKLENPSAFSSPVKEMKSVKNTSEISHMKYCFEMTDKALLATRDFIETNDNISEYDIEQELRKNFKKYGAKSLSFRPIVARNQNSAQAHYMNSSKDEILKDGDLVLIDCGAYYEGGLATDITRVFSKGTPSKLQKTIYTTVVKMFLNAFNYQVAENITTGYEIDSFTREYLEHHKIEGFDFSHGLGHGIGICVHEIPPNLSKNDIAKTPLKNNMCFTIEPGLYNNEHFGVRLENTCYLENGIIKSFSNMCYEKKLIDYSLLSNIEKEWLSDFEVK